MRVGPRRAAMPGATPAGGTGVEPAGNSARRRGPGQTGGGEVVVRRAQAAADDEQVWLGGEGVLQSRREALLVVGDREDAGHLDPPGAEVGAQEGAVGVAGAAVEELVAAAHDGRTRDTNGAFLSAD